MNKKEHFITPTPLDKKIVEEGEKFKKINSDIKLETERDLEAIQKLILDEKKSISELKEKLNNLKGVVRFDVEEAEIEFEDLNANLKDAEKSYLELLELEKRCLSLLDDSTLSDIEVSFYLEKLEKETEEFKQALLKKQEGEDN